MAQSNHSKVNTKKKEKKFDEFQWLRIIQGGTKYSVYFYPFPEGDAFEFRSASRLILEQNDPHVSI